MKILYFLAHPESVGGAMKVMLTQAYIMQQNGNQVQVIIQNNDENKHIPEYEELCKQYNLKNTSTQYPIATCIENIDILECVSQYKTIKKIVQDFEPDILHSLQLNTTVEYVARELDIPHVMNIYPVSDGMFHIEWLNIFPQYHSGDSYFFCRKWEQGLGIETKCIRVAYQNNNILINNNKNIKDKIEIINIGVFAKYKRQLEIIKAVEKCKQNGYKVHISFLGNDSNSYARQCKEFVKERGLDNQVSFVGQVLGVERYLQQADLLIHASTCESYPGVIVEAMGNRVPVLVTPVAGVPELVKDEINGFLTKGYTDKDLYDAFTRYSEYRNSEKIQVIIEHAYETYLLNHTYDDVYKKLNDYYNKMINDKNSKFNRYAEITKNFEMILEFGRSIGIDNCLMETKKHLWYLYHIKQDITKKKYKTAIIWGAGYWGKIALEWCNVLSLHVNGIVDSFKEGEYEGIFVCKPSFEKITEADVVFLAIADIGACEENIRVIEKAGKIRNINYFLTCNNPCIQTEWME